MRMEDRNSFAHPGARDNLLTNLHGLHAEQQAEFPDFSRDVSHSHRAVVRWPLDIPVIDKTPGTN